MAEKRAYGGNKGKGGDVAIGGVRDDHEQRDERGLTPWHYGRRSPGAPREQYICGTCNCRPCHDDCPEQWMPDTVGLKAERARMTVEEWAAAHPEWMEKSGEKKEERSLVKPE